MIQSSLLSVTILLGLQGGDSGGTGARSLLSALRRSISVDWEDVEMTDAFRDLSTHLGVSIIVAPALKDRADEPLSLQVKKSRASNVLKLVADLYQVKFLSSKGVLVATTEEDAIKRTARLQIHDARAALYAPRNFKPPREMGIRVGEEYDDDDEVEQPEALSPEDLVDILRRGTGESLWEYKGVSIECNAGRLVVRHTPTVQRKIARILALLSAF